jgi:hypothetical protein
MFFVLRRSSLILTVMDLTLPLIAFLFVCLIFPKIVRNRPQFYIAFALLVLILLFNILSAIFINFPDFVRFLMIMSQVFLLGAFILLVLCAGGLSLHELSGEVFRSFEVMRRGETEKTTIIPLTGQKPRVKEDDYDEPPPPRQTIDEPTSPPPSPDSSSSIPLEERQSES